MTTDIYHSDDAENQYAGEAGDHAVDALHTSTLSHAQRLFDEACTAVERAQHDDSGQLQRETAWDCYD